MLKLLKMQEYGFTFFIIFTYVSYIAGIIGAFSINPMFVGKVDFYAKLYICIFLLVRFNPFRKDTKFTSLDRKIAFSSGVFLFTTVVVNGILSRYTKEIKTFL